MLLIVATALAGGIDLPDFEGDVPTTPLEQYEADRLHCVQLKDRFDATASTAGVMVGDVYMPGTTYDLGYDVLSTHWAVGRGPALGITVEDFATAVGDADTLRRVGAQRAGLGAVGVAMILAGVAGIGLAVGADQIDTATYLALGGTVVGAGGATFLFTRPKVTDGAHDHYDQQEAGGWAESYNSQLQLDLGLSDDAVARFDVRCGTVESGRMNVPDAR